MFAVSLECFQLVLNKQNLLRYFAWCVLVGIEVATDLSPEIINEGSKYLSALIINKVCTARVCCSSDANQVTKIMLLSANNLKHHKMILIK